MRSRWAREGVRGCAVALAVAALLVVCPPAVAGTPDREAGLGLTVEVGYAGRTGGAEWIPVTVTVQPDRLVAGVLAVEAQTRTGRLREERDIEVAVGSRNAYQFVLPRGAIVATLDEGAGDPATVRAPQPRDSGAEFLAGVLGGVPADPPPLRSEPLAASGVWVGVEPQWAELSAGALQPLSGLVAEARTLAALSEHGLRNVVAAVAAGMDLVVVEPGSGDLDLPWALDEQAWTLPATHVVDGAEDGDVAATVVPAGRGRVALVDAALGDGALGRSPALWSALIEPRVPPAEDANPGWPGMLSSVLGAGSAGVPTLPWLAVFLVAYIVVVGPVNGLVLARFRRRELAWVTVPAVTVVFTAGGWLGAMGSQPPVGFAGSATAWVDGAASQSVVTVARAPTPGQRQLVLPGDDWEVRSEGAGEAATVRRAGSLQGALELPALQPGVLVARRVVDASPPLAVEAAATGEGLQVTVTNTATATMGNVDVRAATASSRIGDLQPGETRSVTIQGDHLPVDQGPWGGGPMPMGGGGAMGGAGEGPRALEAVLADVLDGNPGLVWVVGTVPTSDTGATVDGRSPQDLGSYVAVGVQATGPPRVHTVDRALVDVQDGFRPAPLIVEGNGPVVLRYRIPPTGMGAPLRALLDTQQGRPPGEPGPELALWQRGERQWRALEDALPGGTGAPDGYVSPLGEVYVRASGPLFPLFISGMGLTVEDRP